MTAYARVATVVVMAISLIGCTALRPLIGTTPELRERIAGGTLLKTGDRVLLVTTDGVKHEFKVTAVGTATVDGNGESVAIDQIVSVETRRFSVERTVILCVIAGAVVIVGVLAIIHSLHFGYVPNGPS